MSDTKGKVLELKKLLEARIARERDFYSSLDQMPIEEVPFWVVDVETTGGEVERDRIIEVAAIKIQEEEMKRVISTLVNPKRHIPNYIQRLTGITNRMIADAPTPEEVYPWLFSHLRQGVFVAHSASFDRGFIDQEAIRLGLEPLSTPNLCTVRLSRRLIFDINSYSLDSIAWYFGLEFGRASSPRSRHRALGDAWVCARAFLSLLELAKKIGVSTFGELKELERMPIKKAWRLWKR